MFFWLKRQEVVSLTEFMLLVTPMSTCHSFDCQSPVILIVTILVGQTEILSTQLILNAATGGHFGHLLTSGLQHLNRF